MRLIGELGLSRGRSRSRSLSAREPGAEDSNRAPLPWRAADGERWRAVAASAERDAGWAGMGQGATRESLDDIDGNPKDAMLEVDKENEIQQVLFHLLFCGRLALTVKLIRLDSKIKS